MTDHRAEIGGEKGYNRPNKPRTFGIPPGCPLTKCKSCQAPIHWIVTTSKRRMPVNPDGVSHFETCPHAKEHRRPTLPRELEHKELSVLRAVAEGRPLSTARTDNRIAFHYLVAIKLIALNEKKTAYVLTDAGRAEANKLVPVPKFAEVRS